MNWKTPAATLLLTTILAASAVAQEPAPTPVRPEFVPLPFPGDGRVTDSRGHAQTWDGRVFIVPSGSPSTWNVYAFRPEAVETTPVGVPRFGTESFSPPVALPQDSTQNFALALVPAPGVAENPFPCDAAGRPQAGGAYLRYELLVIAHQGRVTHATLGQRRARVVVREPGTPRASIQGAWLLTPFQPLRDRTGTPLRGFEPTATFDGRLLVFQGTGTPNVLMYSFNDTSGRDRGWSPQRSIVDMFYVDRATPVAGIRFDERYPLAKRVLRSADGLPYLPGQLYRGTYPWISHDGTELFHAKIGTGSAAVVGRWTGNTTRHIDSPLKPGGDARGPAIFRATLSSPGAKPTFWTPYPGAETPLPYTAARPVYPLFGTFSPSYEEVSFEDHEDGDYVVYLHMNELLSREFGQVDLRRTPDTSGRSNTGLLVGAKFPLEYDGRHHTVGLSGQAIYFPDGGGVRVRRSASLDAPRAALTVEAHVRRLVDLDRDGEDRRRYLLHRPGAWSLVLLEDGRIEATVRVGSAVVRSGPVGPPLALGEWAHVAFSWDGRAGVLQTWVGGVLAGERRSAPGLVAASSADLLLGPAGQSAPAPFLSASQAVLLLDQVAVSRVVRSEGEIARAALRALPQPAWRQDLPLPQGLDPAELRVPPQNPVTPQAAALGRLLFLDPRLSGPGTISCATCHDPRKGFGDGLPTARGIGGKVLSRNSPTVVNRALSTRQFWDGRAASLEEQVVMPIVNPDEMGNTIEDVLAYLRAAPAYRTLFRWAYGEEPGEENLAQALATFLRTLTSGGSRVDRYEAGDLAALTPSEVRGRLLFRTEARCVSCHGGSNYSDEAFHATGNTLDADLGRAAVSKRAGELGAFKTPTLRDVALTAPYFHDGSAETLEQVIERYDRGGLRLQPRDDDLRPLGLTPRQKADLAAFLRALTQER